MKQRMRLDKLLSHMGFGSRRDVKRMIKEQAITVNHATCKDSGMQVDPASDLVKVNGEMVVYRKYVYLMLHKPSGVISATEDDRHRTVIDLLDASYRNFALFPVGRLDKDTEGLLFLTNDGQLAHQLLSPKYRVSKHYYAEVEGLLQSEDIKRFKQGLTLDDGYTTLPADLKIVGVDQDHRSSQAEVTLVEGKYHQVKRMFATVGKKVVYLKRMAMGGVSLDPALQLGQYRELTEQELAILKENESFGSLE